MGHSARSSALTPASQPQPIYAPAYIQNLAPYVPGKPIEETQREYGLKKVIKLASNENPLGPSPKALAYLKKRNLELHRYPDASAYHLKKELASGLKVHPSQIIVGNGSNEIIDFVIRTYATVGDSIVTSEAAFVAYKICAQIHGVATLEAKLTSDLRTDLSEVAKLVRDHPRAKIVFIANPNNPTGTYNTRKEFEKFLGELSKIRKGSTLLVLDYAYWEYVTAADLPDPGQLAALYPNTLILRTFSKIYGLAGLRVGYAYGPQNIVQTLEKVRQPFNLSSPAMGAAIEALKDSKFKVKARQVNRAGMQLWEKELKKMGIPYWPSQGNFLLLDTQKGLGKSGVEVYQAALKLGVIFRPVANYGLHHALRVSIGTSPENRAAIKVLKTIARSKG